MSLVFSHYSWNSVHLFTVSPNWWWNGSCVLSSNVSEITFRTHFCHSSFHSEIIWTQFAESLCALFEEESLSIWYDQKSDCFWKACQWRKYSQWTSFVWYLIFILVVCTSCQPDILQSSNLAFPVKYCVHCNLFHPILLNLWCFPEI